MPSNRAWSPNTQGRTVGQVVILADDSCQHDCQSSVLRDEHRPYHVSLRKPHESSTMPPLLMPYEDGNMSTRILGTMVVWLAWAEMATKSVSMRAV